MLGTGLVVLLSLGYLGILFITATWGDRRADQGRPVIRNGLVYTLSLTVYCTAWTYYGSVGLAASDGLAFLPIYLGPTLAAFLFPFVLHKMLRIAKAYGITSIADFIGARYGKSGLLGGLVTIVAVVGAIPYISLQLKALSASIAVVASGPIEGIPTPWGADTALTITLVLAIFSIFFGTRHIDATETHQGMVLAIALESIVKLLAFLTVGVYVTYVMHDGMLDIARQAIEAGHGALFTMGGTKLSWLDWALMTLLAGCAVFVLPRQFQVQVIENVDDRHLGKATWLFPAYLLLINIFVMPLALAGLVAGSSGDLIILELPMRAGSTFITALTFLGGLSAATAMIIVVTIALSTMISNDLVMPILLRVTAFRTSRRRDLNAVVLYIRRAAILLLLVMGYGFFRLIGGNYGLVSIGLISFTAVAQFVPAILAAMYWREANRIGALMGITAGFAIWLYTLILPAIVGGEWFAHEFLANSIFSHELFHPQALFGMTGLNPISHAVVWSLSVNLLLLVLGSLLGSQSNLERSQALAYVDVYERAGVERLWRGESRVSDLISLLIRFLGRQQAEKVLNEDERARGTRLRFDEPADGGFVQLVERRLARAIGAASARVMVSSVVRGEVIGPNDVMQIIDETSQVIEYSQRLEQKSRALQRATAELKKANQRLTQLDRMKDDFLATVSHELRTPLTSIRSFSEILLDSPDLDVAERGQFLSIVVRESERLTRLINDVLDLSKIESGNMDWHVVRTDLVEIIDEAMATMQGVFADKSLSLERGPMHTPAPVDCDRDRMVQVVVNLLSNALKFSPDGSGRVRVSLHATEEGYRVTVEDNGPGVPERHRDQIFAKFHQANEGLKDRPKGTGLGLTICQQIVQHFEGRIWCEDSELGGAALSFTLPAPVPEAVAAK